MMSTLSFGEKHSSIQTRTNQKSSENLIPSVPQNIVSKDAYQRINFLYQAAMQVLANQPCNVELVRYYIKCLRDVKEKRVLRWAREMKQSICNGCNMLLVPGITGSVKIGENGQNVMTCLSCYSEKRKNSHTFKCKRKRRNKKWKMWNETILLDHCNY